MLWVGKRGTRESKQGAMEIHPKPGRSNPNLGLRADPLSPHLLYFLPLPSLHHHHIFSRHIKHMLTASRRLAAAAAAVPRILSTSVLATSSRSTTTHFYFSAMASETLLPQVRALATHTLTLCIGLPIDAEPIGRSGLARD
jgi:hypothetical protein